jgi:hypothetical protein
VRGASEYWTESTGHREILTPMSNVRPMLGLSISFTNKRAAPVDGTVKKRVFSSVGLNSSDHLMSG